MPHSRYQVTRRTWIHVNVSREDTGQLSKVLKTVSGEMIEKNENIWLGAKNCGADRDSESTFNS